MRKRLMLLLSVLLSFTLIAAACGDDDDSGDGGNLGIAFDTGGRGDGTFNDAAGRGADKAAADLGVSVDELEAITEEDRGPNLEALVENGNNPIIAVGFAFGDALAPIAEANPDVFFGWIDGYYDGANVITTGFAEHEGSFLVGVAAALNSPNGNVGFIGGQEIDLIKKFEAGFTAGAQAVNPDIVVHSQYLGAAGDNSAWGSPDKAKEIALAWFADGTDVVYTAAGGSGRGTIEAAVEAGDGKFAIGVDSDECAFDTDEQKEHRLTSMLKRVDTAVFLITEAVQNGTAEGGFQPFDLSNDGVGYATTCGNLSDDVIDQIEAFKEQIVAGDLVVPDAV
ncbi:MAG: BMP family ABC transporter substrate-binding protein [Acidimicrobiaceae bacterium]